MEGNLPATLQKIPIEKRFNKNYVREICREADGYQSHLVSPERGIRRLVAEAMKLTNDHVHRFVDEIHVVLMESVRECVRRSVVEDSGAVTGKAPGTLDFLRLKGFENAVITAATEAMGRSGGPRRTLSQRPWSRWNVTTSPPLSSGTWSGGSKRRRDILVNRKRLETDWTSWQQGS